MIQMRSVDTMDMNTCCKHSTSQVENHHNNNNNNKGVVSRTKPTPSKWDDAQKWLVGFSGGGNDRRTNEAKPRNSNAEDRRLLHSASQRGRDSCSSADTGLEDQGETKKIDCGELVMRFSRPVEDSQLGVKAVSLRDFGTEMTPVGSKDASRATTPVLESPLSSRFSTPGRCDQAGNCCSLERRNDEEEIYGTSNGNGWVVNREGSVDGTKQIRKLNPLESRAMAWDEAERAKYMARCSFDLPMLSVTCDMFMNCLMID